MNVAFLVLGSICCLIIRSATQPCRSDMARKMSFLRKRPSQKRQTTSRIQQCCCRTWPSYGLCPFQSSPGDLDMLFRTEVDESCKDNRGNERFVPCLFSAGFSCVMAFFNSTAVISGCIRDRGSKLVRFQRALDNPDVVEVVDLHDVFIGRSCVESETCSLAEVSINQGKSPLILKVCCCKGNHCTDPKAYSTTSINATHPDHYDVPFGDVFQLYVLSVCYATTLAAITVNFSLSLYGVYCNRVIVKNQ